MAEFICRLGTPAGEVVTRTVEAPGINEARAHLEREGFKVFNVTPPKTSGVTALTQFGRLGAQARVKANDFLLFNQQLAALIRAGIPILQAISMLRKRAASARLRAVLGDVEEEIRGGSALSEAFAATSFAASATTLITSSAPRDSHRPSSTTFRSPASTARSTSSLGRSGRGVEPLRHLHASQRWTAPQDPGCAGLSGFSALCVAVHDHFSERLRRAAHVRTVYWFR